MTEQSGGAYRTSALLLLAALCIPSSAQQKDPSQPDAATSTTQAQSTTGNPKSADSSAQKPATTQMTPAEARQAKLLADTERLYQLTQELKDEVAKSNKDTLSVAVIKKADEVEKLAKSLKERMRTSQ